MKKDKDKLSVEERLTLYGGDRSLLSLSPPFTERSEATFTFIDLFAGIGGFRLPLQQLGGTCIFSSEWDKQAQMTYYANYGEIPYGDIRLDSIKALIPDDFDVLCAGFPCQAFSIAGQRKGFEEARGTLFFEVADILKRHLPKAFFLENVKGLVSHDKGRTLRVILKILRDELGYYVPEPKVLNAKDFGVPQNRERIYIVGFHPSTGVNAFEYPVGKAPQTTVASIIEENVVSVKYYLSTQYIDTLKKHKARHVAKGNGFGYQVLDLNNVANAIVCGGMGRERNLVVDKRLTDFTPVTNIKGEVNREGIRRMTPREWARLQGFPDDFKIVVSDTAAYIQFGNSVAIPVIKEIGKSILNHLKIKISDYERE